MSWMAVSPFAISVGRMDTFEKPVKPITSRVWRVKQRKSVKQKKKTKEWEMKKWKIQRQESVGANDTVKEKRRKKYRKQKEKGRDVA